MAVLFAVYQSYKMYVARVRTDTAARRWPWLPADNPSKRHSCAQPTGCALFLCSGGVPEPSGVSRSGVFLPTLASEASRKSKLQPAPYLIRSVNFKLRGFQHYETQTSGGGTLMGLAVMSAVAGMKNPMVGGQEMYPTKNIVENAVNSADHTTLVAAVKAAGLVETLEGLDHSPCSLRPTKLSTNCRPAPSIRC
jgi:hypothetical protein